MSAAVVFDATLLVVVGGGLLGDIRVAAARPNSKARACASSVITRLSRNAMGEVGVSGEGEGRAADCASATAALSSAISVARKTP